MNLKVAVAVWARVLARDTNPRVVKRVLECVSAILSLAYKGESNVRITCCSDTPLSLISGAA